MPEPYRHSERTMFYRVVPITKDLAELGQTGEEVFLPSPHGTKLLGTAVTADGKYFILTFIRTRRMLEKHGGITQSL